MSDMSIKNLLTMIGNRLNLTTDYVVEQGTISNWNYEKWKSGKKKCWRRHDVDSSISTARGKLYSGSYWTEALPFTFTEIPRVFAKSSISTDYYILDIQVKEITVSDFKARLWATEAMSINTHPIDFYVVGK